MKHTRLTIKLIFALNFVFLLSSCVEDIEGTFYISDTAKKYEIDTTITTLKFIDNHGISDDFCLVDIHRNYTYHNCFDAWGSDGDAWGESYMVSYYSTVNRFYFEYILRADVEETDLTIDWNQKDIAAYNFATGSFNDDVKFNFYDTLTVRGVKYHNIIELDYSELINEIDKNTPVKTYISGDKGLIKFERKDKIIFERIE